MKKIYKINKNIFNIFYVRIFFNVYLKHIFNMISYNVTFSKINFIDQFSILQDKLTSYV